MEHVVRGMDRVGGINRVEVETGWSGKEECSDGDGGIDGVRREGGVSPWEKSLGGSESGLAKC